MDEKSITDNKKFWTTVTPFLSDKTPFNANITLIDDGEIISSDNEIADVLNTFCTNIDPVLKAIVKYKDDPNIKATERVPKSKDLSNFSTVEKKKIFQEIV